MQNQVYKYKAFISYRHQDEKVAVELQRFLEKFRLPVKLSRKFPDRPKRLGHVFRDATHLPPAELSRAIDKALRSSEYLVVLCSEWTNKPNEDGKRWVEEEVKQFLALDEQNKYKVIPVLLPRKDMSMTRECMPPSVVKLDILATDMARKGAKAAYYDVVAAMLNLDPVDLFDKGEAEERRRRRMRQVGVGVLSTGILAGAFFAWDYYVPKHRYYASYEERNNIPVGIHEYSRKDLQTLGGYYRFTEVRGKVREVEYCDHRGRMADVLPYEWQTVLAPGARYSYDEQGKPQECVHVDKYGKTKVTRRFSSDKTIEYKKTRQTDGAVFSGRASDLALQHTFTLEEQILGKVGFRNDIEVYEVTRENGYIVQEFFRNHDGMPRQDETGAWGRRYVRDSQGRIHKILFTDQEGKPMMARKGICGLEVDYGMGPMPERLRYLGEQQEPMARYGVNEARYKWQSGNVVEQSFHDATGNLVMNSEVGFAFSKHKLLSNGALAEERYYDASGDPVDSLLGNAGLKYEYGDDGNLTKIVNLDTSGQPVAGIEGWCSMTIEYDDDSGRETRFAMFDAQGRPCRSREGYASTIMIYDGNGNTRRQEFYGENGKLCLTGLGHAILETSYNNDGRLEEIRSFGEDKKPIVNVNGFFKIRMEYDPDGEGKGESYYGIDGRPCFSKWGYSSIKISKEKNGMGVRQEWRFYGTEGEAVLCRDGYAGMLALYNEYGYLVSRSFLGTKGEIIAPPGREATELYEYDKAGNRVQIISKDPAGNLVMKVSLHHSGARTQLHYNPDLSGGKLKEIDAKGRVTREMFVDVEGNPVAQMNGCAGIRREYDDCGNETLLMNLGVDGKPVLTDGGIAGIRREYDDRGNETLKLFLGVDGKPILGRSGIAGIRREYDDRGNETLLMFLGVDVKPVLTKRGYAGVHREYSTKGKETLKIFLGTKGEPMCLPEGYAAERMEYDSEGRITLHQCLDDRLCLVNDSEGIAQTQFRYSDFSECRTFLDANGHTVNCPFGFAYQDIKNNEQGKPLEITYRNAAGAPVALTNGTFRKAYRYDESGKNRIRTEYYDREGKLLRAE